MLFRSERFHAQLDRVRAMGFDERFIRMWDFYLGICEAAFLERHTSVYQLMLVKNGTRSTMFNEPWRTDAPHVLETNALLEESATR